MSDGRPSASVSLHSSVGVTSAEELAEKYQKLFSEFSRIKAQHSVLKKAVIKEQEANAALQSECKSKERELRSSNQQLDLLSFHNQRLTKRIECLQDSSTARLKPGWLVGSAKKELEKAKVTLDVTSIDLTRKIEENEKLHKELYEVNSLYAQRTNDLQAKIADYEKKIEDLQDELTRSHLASEEALSTIRQEKRELDSELDQTRAELRKIKSQMEKNEQKLREGDDMIRAEVITTLSINLGLEESLNGQFDTLQGKIDKESNELFTSFRQVQSIARDYLKSVKEKSASSHEKGLKVKDASQIWHRNLQNFAEKLTSTNNRVSELTVEKEDLVKANTAKFADLDKEITRLKDELKKQKATGDALVEDGRQSYAGNSMNVLTSVPISAKTEDGSDSGDDAPLLVNGFDEDQNDHPESKEIGSPMSFENVQMASEDDGDDVFVYPGNTDANINGGTLALERDIGRVTKSEDEAKQRELHIKNYYETKISQLSEQLQLSDSKSVRLFKSIEVMKGKLTESENEKLRSSSEVSRLQHELSLMKEKIEEEKENHRKQIETFTEYMNQPQGNYAGTSKYD